MNKLNEFMNKNINKMIIIFLLLSPIFDLITSLSLNVLKIDFNFIIIIKGLFLIILTYYYIFISKKNKISNIFLISIFLYLILFIFNILINKDIHALIYEFTNTFKTFYFPLIIILIYQLYIDNKLKIEIKYFIYTLLEYIILLFIPIITNTGFNSYDYSKVGSIGWFNSTNEIGAIISILLPLLIAKIIELKNKLLKIILLLIILYIYLMIGTKVPTLTLIITLLVFLCIYIYKAYVNKKYKILSCFIIFIILSIIGSYILIPKTSFYKNIKIHLEFLNITSISDFTNIHNIDHFIFSERLTFMKKTEQNYLKESLDQKLIGIGYIENYGTDKVSLKMIEMDYYDILYRHGIIGFIIFLLPLIYIIYNNFKIHKFKNIALNLSIILIFILSLFSGHVLIAPSVSYIVSLLIIFWLTNNEVNV